MRCYLSGILRDKCRVSTEEATSTASAWKLGSGEALRRHDVHSFRVPFGAKSAHSCTPTRGWTLLC